jgi:tripeptidyl-peptidase-1
LTSLPKYQQLKVNITATYPAGGSVEYSQGISSRFALTDVATTNFLADLYNIPHNIRVNYGSNQSVAEFYGEFYSNTDLENFLGLSGLPNATIPTANVYGDLPNNYQKPGGEAQLDVEYIMALAPGAETYFYSMADYNPNDPLNATSKNEGFLQYLWTVDQQEFPPLVHSLSYGDIENVIFNASHNGSVLYGDRCNQEFIQMGLRGLTVLFSSGDDGIGSSIIRDDEETACRRSHPEWPASSPYVTSVGATQMTDKYLPICGKQYSVSGAAWQGLPPSSQLDVQCSGTGETVCTSIFGGVITSGGGFSDVMNRSYAAPWQKEVVDYYLRTANAANYPPNEKFNAQGRGYPDVATYGSNYFIVLGGQLTRESGTSASAPVFAAMVTLWNDIRLAYGLPPMGFIAPFLYDIYAKNPDAFHDVVTGNNVSMKKKRIL